VHGAMHVTVHTTVYYSTVTITTVHYCTVHWRHKCHNLSVASAQVTSTNQGARGAYNMRPIEPFIRLL